MTVVFLDFEGVPIPDYRHGLHHTLHVRARTGYFGAPFPFGSGK